MSQILPLPEVEILCHRIYSEPKVLREMEEDTSKKRSCKNCITEAKNYKLLVI